MPGLRDSKNSLDWIMPAGARISRSSSGKPASKVGQMRAPQAPSGVTNDDSC